MTCAGDLEMDATSDMALVNGDGALVYHNIGDTICGSATIACTNNDNVNRSCWLTVKIYDNLTDTLLDEGDDWIPLSPGENGELGTGACWEMIAAAWGNTIRVEIKWGSGLINGQQIKGSVTYYLHCDS